MKRVRLPIVMAVLVALAALVGVVWLVARDRASGPSNGSAAGVQSAHSAVAVQRRPHPSRAGRPRALDLESPIFPGDDGSSATVAEDSSSSAVVGSAESSSAPSAGEQFFATVDTDLIPPAGTDHADFAVERDARRLAKAWSLGKLQLSPEQRGQVEWVWQKLLVPARKMVAIAEDLRRSENKFKTEIAAQGLSEEEAGRLRDQFRQEWLAANAASVEAYLQSMDEFAAMLPSLLRPYLHDEQLTALDQAQKDLQALKAAIVAKTQAK